MSITHTSGALSQIKSVSRAVGIEVPEALTADVDRINQTETGAEATGASLRADTAAAVTAATRAALSAGRDPYADKAVTEARTAAAAAEVRLSNIVKQWAEDARAEAIAEHLPALLTSWAALVDEAQVAVTAARKAVPAADFTDPNAGTLAPAHHASTWALAVEGCTKADRIVGLWQRLNGQVNGAGFTPSLILADLTAAELDKVGRSAKAARIAQAGHALELATPEEYRARAERVRAERAAAAAQREAESRALASSGRRADGALIHL